MLSLTPRQYKAQLDMHAYIQEQMNGKDPNRNQSTGYIDQLPGW